MKPTKDGRFFIQKMECLGYCEQAPVMRINNKYIGNVTKELAIKKLEEL
jgi:NADH:ubiquinone oxidoreductase subunit E